MVLTVHHLGISQSERIIWLCEELNLHYELKKYNRNPIFSPPEYLALHPIGAAPVITDGELKLAESEACAAYIVHIYGDGKLAIKPGQENYADYLYWFCFTNGTLQPALLRATTMKSAGLSDENAAVARTTSRIHQGLDFVNRRLGEVPWLAGQEFTGADIMIVFSW